jgi:hypothetical protein
LRYIAVKKIRRKYYIYVMNVVGLQIPAWIFFVLPYKFVWGNKLAYFREHISAQFLFLLECGKSVVEPQGESDLVSNSSGVLTKAPGHFWTVDSMSQRLQNHVPCGAFGHEQDKVRWISFGVSKVNWPSYEHCEHSSELMSERAHETTYFMHRLCHDANSIQKLHWSRSYRLTPGDIWLTSLGAKYSYVRI